MTPSLLELCDHARRSCMVNGLIPLRWHFGRDAIDLLFEAMDADGAENLQYFVPFGVFQGMAVFPMKASGVACIGKKPYMAMLGKGE